ncbi:MAG: ribosomal-processing cysteine protease Prp [Erysipelotrichaceae bacterium]|jgi:uncharacterized protein YsxB (DUF464 family)
MVNVRIVRNNRLISSLQISGHANAAEYGKDLVCAGISSIAVGLANAIDILNKESCIVDVDENFVSISVVNNNEIIQTILKTGIIQLQTIEEQFPENIRIKITEV